MRPARAGIVAPLGLDVIEQARQLLVGLDLAADQLGHDLFVRHGQHHVMIVLVQEAAHLRADLVPAAGRLPDFGRMDDGHGDFLAADGFHLLPQDILNLGERTPGQVQVAEDARAQLADEAGAHEQSMAGDIRVRGRFAQGLTEQTAHSHVGGSPTSRVAGAAQGRLPGKRDAPFPAGNERAATWGQEYHPLAHPAKRSSAPRPGKRGRSAHGRPATGAEEAGRSVPSAPGRASSPTRPARGCCLPASRCSGRSRDLG
jgi:hypothetical protein